MVLPLKTPPTVDFMVHIDRLFGLSLLVVESQDDTNMSGLWHSETGVMRNVEDMNCAIDVFMFVLAVSDTAQPWKHNGVHNVVMMLQMIGGLMLHFPLTTLLPDDQC